MANCTACSRGTAASNHKGVTHTIQGCGCGNSNHSSGNSVSGAVSGSSNCPSRQCSCVESLVNDWSFCPQPKAGDCVNVPSEACLPVSNKAGSGVGGICPPAIMPFGFERPSIFSYRFF